MCPCIHFSETAGITERERFLGETVTNLVLMHVCTWSVVSDTSGPSGL